MTEVPTPQKPIRIGMVTGLLGGSLAGAVDGFLCLVDRLASSLPSFPAAVDVVKLLAGLALLALPLALGGALLFGLVGATIRLVRPRLRAERQVAFHLFLLVTGMTLLVLLDRVGFDAVIRSGGYTLACLLAGASLVAGWAGWFLFRSLARTWQEGRAPLFRPLRWPAARNLAFTVLAVLILLPAGSVVTGRRRAAAAAPGATPSPETARGRPNLLLVTIDTLRADHLGAYGYEGARTPNLDALAAEGLLFEQATAQSPWTFPSMASLFTSRYPGELGLASGNRLFMEIKQQRVGPGRRLLAEELRDAGYYTSAVVTNPWLQPHFGLTQGFEDYVFVDERRFFHIEGLKDLLVLKLCARLPVVDRWIRSAYEGITGPAGRAEPMEVDAGRVTEEAVRSLRERCRSPFFLWVHYIDPHSPLDPPAPFKPDLGGLPEKRRAFLASYNGKDILTGIARLEKEDRQALVALYDGEIAYVDHCVGALLHALDDLGLADETLVIVTSDHGEEFWDHGGFQHGHTLYDELIRVPLLMRGQGIAKGRHRVREQVRLLDLMPTLLDLAGRPHPPGLKGRSLAPILEGGTGDAPFAFSEGLYLTEEKKAVRGQGWKLIYLPGSGTYELYDLAKDPGEKREVSVLRPEVFQRMRSVLERWLGSGDS